MDRLVCGDVGFGKTEVAVRAAFAVAVNGKQVLMLAPTTILAEQHWNTFRDRYRDFPVRVEMVSRFRTPPRASRCSRDFAEGKVDVLIGTHRVLSRDVIPKELGLVILDEEQRFGVAQKELLQLAAARGRRARRCRATPIPRTLHMSLVRAARHLDHRDAAARAAARSARPSASTTRSWSRRRSSASTRASGQAFYLHNRVETIEEAAQKLQQLCPELRFLVAHGQMREKRARGEDARVPARRRRRARLDDDHRVGHRHPAGEHADRRARGHARPRRSSTRSAAASAAPT